MINTSAKTQFCCAELIVMLIRDDNFNCVLMYMNMKASFPALKTSPQANVK